MTDDITKGASGASATGPEAELDLFFADLRQSSKAVPDDLMARVLADADAYMPKAPSLAPVAGKAPAARGFWSALWGTLGGASFAGLAVAGVAGLWVGLAQPFDIDFGLGLQAATLETIDLFPADLEQWTQALGSDLLVEDSE